ncbi:hypothetical protein ACK3SF_05620 [Candidatus Nanosalina sp. VS9-1]|uniref:hypothetical protein n=1 Tax=Candidatus Nanosalina sp. VS9-1 TaxID=3388566 RepID=UPI0039DF3273
MDELRPVKGWKHIKRGLGDDLVLKDENETTSDILATVSADTVFSAFYEGGSSVEEISADTGLKDEKVQEVIDYSESSIGNMHELARESRRKNKLINETSREKFENIAERTLEEDSSEETYETSYIEYMGPVGEFQDLVEEKVDSRGLKVKYDLDEDVVHRSSLEMHVITGRDAEDEVYFGADGKVFYIGSTMSRADKEFRSVEDIREAEEVIDHELNLLSL